MDKIQLSAFALLSHLFFPQPNWPNWAVLICTVWEHSLLWGSAGIKGKNNTGAMFFLSSPCCVLCLVAQSCPALCEPMDCSPPGSSAHGDSAGKNTGVGCHALLQGIVPTQGLNPGLPHCRQILYHLSHQGSPYLLPKMGRGSVISISWGRMGLPQWFSCQESTYNARATGDAVLIPGLGRSPGGGHSNSLKYSCLGNPIDRGAWQGTVHRVANSQTWLKWLSTRKDGAPCPVDFYPKLTAIQWSQRNKSS